jgi:TonB family protein
MTNIFFMDILYAIHILCFTLFNLLNCSDLLINSVCLNPQSSVLSFDSGFTSSHKKGFFMRRLSAVFIPLILVFGISGPLSLSAQTPVEGTDTTRLEETDSILEIETGYDTSGTADSSEETEAEIEKMPEVIHRVTPVYPPQCTREGIEGTVVLECLLSDSGTVDSITLVRSVHPLLDSSAITALRQFKFSPALAGGEPVPVLLQYEIPFTLETVTRKVEQYVNFQGRLLESGTRTPVADAMIVLSFADTTADTTLDVPFSRYLEKIAAFDGQSLEENKLVTLTDSAGKFVFSSLPAGLVMVTSPHPGYEQLMQTEMIRPGEALTVTYYIKRVSYNDYEIVVYGKAEEKEVSRRQLTLTEVRKIPGIGNDAVRVVQALPGVARPSFISGDIIVRGTPSWDSRYYLDGVDLPMLYHFGGLKSVYNSEALGSIDFYPGGFGTRYGGCIGGVIEIKGRQPKTDRWHGQLDLNLIDGSILAEGPVTDNISLLVSARRSFLGDMASWYFEQYPDLFPFSVAPYYYDILARADYTPTDKHHIFVTSLTCRDSMGVFMSSVRGGSSEVSEATDALTMAVSFSSLLTGWEYEITPSFDNSLRYSYTWARDQMSVFGFFAFSDYVHLHHIRDELTYKFSPIAELSVGGDVSFFIDDIILTIPSASGIIHKDTTDGWLFGDVAPYANLKVKLGKNLTITPGIRYDYYPELIHDGGVVPEFWQYSSFDNHRGFSGEPSLRVNARYSVNDKQTIKAAIGNYNQSPQPVGQVIHETWGDPSLPTTKAAHYLAGYEWQITDLISADIQAYINRQWNIPRMASDEELEDNPEALWLPNEKGRMEGLEILLRHQNNGRFFGWIAYTLSRSERWNPVDKKWQLFSKDQTHNLQLLASYHLNHEWDIGTRIRFVTGDPTTPVVDIIENENYSYIQPIEGKPFSSRMDPFFQVDIRVDKKFVYKKWMLSTYLDIQNISWLFYKSPEMVIQNYDYTDSQPVSMIIQPALGIKVEF